MHNYRLPLFSLVFFLAFTASIAVVGCASHPTIRSSSDVYDPYEASNRRALEFHLKLDRGFLKPLAMAYAKVFMPPVRARIDNFGRNLSTPLTLLHDILQGEGKRGGVSLARFLINSTLGLFGLFDPASTLGLIPHSEDFGQTLARWGVPSGPYLFIPVLGPRSSLSFGSSIVDIFADPAYKISDIDTPTRIFLDLLNALEFRASTLDYLDDIERDSIDFYASLRSFYWQNRQNQIRNQRIDIDTLPDIEAFEEYDESP